MIRRTRSSPLGMRASVYRPRGDARFRRLGVALTFVLAVGACARGFQVRDYPTPVSLYSAGLAQFRLGKWDNAVTAFDQVTILLPPRDSLLPRAHYYLALTYEKQKHHLLAAASFKRVVDGFPDDSLADDALIGMGDAYSAAWRGPSFDKSDAEQALDAYVLLQRLFPASSLLKRAQAGEARINEGLAQKDYLNGVFYVKRNAFDSALLYFKAVVDQHTGTVTAHDALLQMVAINKRLHYVADAADACRTLRTTYAPAADIQKACAGIAADSGR